jgi:hypothetical protein
VRFWRQKLVLSEKENVRYVLNKTFSLITNFCNTFPYSDNICNCLNGSQEFIRHWRKMEYLKNEAVTDNRRFNQSITNWRRSRRDQKVEISGTGCDIVTRNSRRQMYPYKVSVYYRAVCRII